MVWFWPGADPNGGPQPTVEIRGSQLIWNLEPDHDFRIPGEHAEQSFEDFRTYGSAWTSAPADVIAQLVAQPGLENPPWLGNADYYPYSPAWHAIERGDEAQAIAAAAVEDPRREFRHRSTLLMQAAARGMLALVDRLLHAGADVNARDERGQSAILRAVRASKASLAMVQCLVEHGADQLDETLAHALFFTVQGDVVEYLLDRGARIEDAGALHTAAGKGWTAVVRKLMARGYDLNRANKDGGTPLMWASTAEMVELLVAAGAEVDAKTPGGETALSHACTRGTAWKVEALLRAGANPNVAGFDWSFGALRGQPILHCLEKLRRSPEIVKLLRAAGAGEIRQ